MIKNFDVEKSYTAYFAAHQGATDSQKQGYKFLLEQLHNDTTILDQRWCAYALATVKWECGKTWQPIEEVGNGKGRTYGFADPVTGHVFYGRGFVQLTWKGNYVTLGKAIGMGTQLIENPSLVLDPDVAYKILSHGMTHGAFTGVGFARFLNNDKTDYINSRKIINGLDQAETIAGYAVEIEKLLVS